MIETDVTAPLADTILTVLKLAAERHRNAQTLADVYGVVATLNGYGADEQAPARYVTACREALDLIRRGEEHLEAALAIPLRNIAACDERARLLDRRAACELEARRIIRHEITLEGPDL